jgi:uncharacterized protein (DUF1330 family)
MQLISLVRLREWVEKVDGRRVSGGEVYEDYCREAGWLMGRYGGRQFHFGAFEATLIGPPSERWDVAYITEYADEDAYARMTQDPRYRTAMTLWSMAVADARVIRMQTVQSW